MQVGLPEEGNIVEIYKFGDDRMLMIKERATYEIRMADMIDPDRTNDKIPNIQQRVLSVGSTSPLLQKILLSSALLFDETYLRDLDCGQLKQHALNAVHEILSMERLLERLASEENEQIRQLEDAKLTNGFIVPNLEDAGLNVKNFLQKSDHFTKELFRITRIFEKGFENPDNLLRRAKRDNPINEEYVKFLESAIPYIRFIREARNSVEHPNPPHKQVIVDNFTLDASGKIAVPAIEIRHPKFPEPKTRLLIFLDATIQSLASLYQSWIAHMCARKVSLSGFDASVMRIPKEARRHEHVAYKYSVFLNGSWQPIG